MRWLASVPFILFIMVLALIAWPVLLLARFSLRTVLQIRGDRPTGPNDAAALALARRALAFFDGQCWKCGAHVTNDT
jgi:hypothetical protein